MMYKELENEGLVIEFEKLIKDADKADEDICIYSALMKQRMLSLSGNN